MSDNRVSLDRISQSYNGELGILSQQKSKLRIDWMCNHVKGNNVLDIGCSQGITTILLGRSGKKIIGIDIEVESIKYANELKANESIEIQKNIEFICGDFLQYKFNNTFDTIIMGEILEHVFEPDLFIEKAKTLLNENGRIIVTVPFGINPFPDHKRTYYFIELYKMLNKWVHVSDVMFFGGWIGFVSEKNVHGKSINIDEKFIHMLENSFYYVDSQKQKSIERFKMNTENIKSKLNKATEMLEMKDKEYERLVTQLENSEKDCTKLNDLIREKESEIKDLEMEIKNMELTKELGKMKSHLMEAIDRKNSNSINDEFLEKLYNANNEISKLTYEKKLYERDIEELKNKVDEINIQNQILIEEREQEKNLLEKKVDDIKLEKSHIEELLNDQNEEIESLKSRICEIKEEKENINKEYENNKYEIIELQKELEKLRNDYECSLIEKGNNDDEIERLTGEIESMAEIVKQTSDEIVMKNEELIRFSEEVERSNESKEKLNEQIAQYKAKIERINRAKKKWQKEKESYNTLLYHAKKKNEAYEKLAEVKLYNYFRKLKKKNDKTEDYASLALTIDTSDKNKVREREEKRDKLIELAAKIPDSNGSRYFNTNKVRIGMIADAFQLETYGDVAEVIYLSPKNYKADIDILFIVSTWHGLKDDWTGLGRPKEEGGVKDDLFNIIKYHREKGAKIVFYSKEDPGNYSVFLYIAKECDYIFTSDIDCVPKYIEDTGNENVYVLPFAINPKVHNPIGFEEHMRDEVVFAGTWGYANKYPERNVDMQILLDGVIDSDKELTIFDRNFYADNDLYKYPLRYDDYVCPPVEHSILMKVHKLFKWAININSSKYSDTMFASRVYELQACGSLIISNFNIGMKKMFPNVFIEFAPYLIKEMFNRMTPQKEYELQIEGIRRMYASETVFHRLDYILEIIGLSKFRQQMERKIVVIVKDKYNVKIQEAFNSQSYNNKVIMNVSDVDFKVLMSADMFTYFDENAEYGEFYLEDMINCFKYADVDFVTKVSFYEDGVLFDGPRNDYYSGEYEISQTIFWRESYSLPSIFDENPESIGECKGYAADALNFSKIKYEIAD